MREDIVERLAESIDSVINLDSISLSSEYYYNSIVFCVIDAIYSIGANYSSTRNTVKRYADYYNLTQFRNYGSSPNSIDNEHTVSDFLVNIEGVSIEFIVEEIFENRQRTIKWHKY